MATLLETDIAHLSENIAQQYAIPALLRAAGRREVDFWKGGGQP